VRDFQENRKRKEKKKKRAYAVCEASPPLSWLKGKRGLIAHVEEAARQLEKIEENHSRKTSFG